MSRKSNFQMWLLRLSPLAQMRFVLTLWIAMLGVSRLTHAQTPAQLSSRIAGILPRMASKDGPTAEAAFDEMLGIVAEDKSATVAAFVGRHPEEANRVKLGFITFLENLNRGNLSYPSAFDPEDVSAHFAQAIDVVSCLGDDRAIPALVHAMGSGAGSCGGLLQFGQKALGPVLNELKNPDPTMRKRAVEYGIAILRNNSGAESQTQALNLIRSSVSDPEFLLRATALEQIEILNMDGRFSQALQQFVPALKQMALSDPFLSPSTGTFRLRAKATELLEKLGSH